MEQEKFSWYNPDIVALCSTTLRLHTRALSGTTVGVGIRIEWLEDVLYNRDIFYTQK